MSGGGCFEHLRRLSDDTGLLEHAKGSVPRREHGYCLDDVARGLVVLSREEDPPASLVELADCYLGFVAHAQDRGGMFRNRLGYDRVWADRPGLGDWWGRALWGLGSVVAGDLPVAQRREALERFTLSSRLRSSWPRTTAFAMLGAAAVLHAVPAHREALLVLRDGIASLPPPTGDPGWQWPEARLSYANAALAEALLAAGGALGDERAVANGVELLGWLVAVQTGDGWLSVVPAGGRGRSDRTPGFDQQPIEVAALADACARARSVTGDRRWDDELARCVAWWSGTNDCSAVMHDVTTGGGFDGLTPDGPNRNQGAESTMAWLMTQRHTRVEAPDRPQPCLTR